MPADIAQRQRAQHGVAQGMDDHVAIAVRLHATIMRHPDATQHDVVARAEGMHVDALADTDVQGSLHGMNTACCSRKPW